MDKAPLAPAGYNKGGPYWEVGEVNKVTVKNMVYGNYFSSKVKDMTNEIEKAGELIQLSMGDLNAMLDKLHRLEDELKAKTKTVTGSVRDSAQKLGEGLVRVQKTADFQKLESYVALLERAEKSLMALGDLHDSGKLEKIANALK